MGFLSKVRGLFSAEKKGAGGAWVTVGEWFSNKFGGDWLKGYAESSRLQFPVRAIAEDSAVVDWHIRQGMEQATSGALVEFLDNPHPLLTWNQIIELTSVYRDLVGIAPWRVMRGPEGQIQVWPFPRTWIREWASSENGDRFKVCWLGTEEEVPGTDILMFFRPDPRDPYRKAMGIAQGLDHDMAIEEAMSDFVVHSFYNEATPPLIVGIPDASDKELKDEQAKWKARRTGPRQARKALFVNSQVHVKELRANLKDLEFNGGRKLSRDFFLQAFGVPPERGGIVENSNRSTIDGADFQQQSKNVKPRLKYFAKVLNRDLRPLFGPKYREQRFAFEEPVKESQAERRQTAEMLARTGLATIDECRALVGKPPLPDGQGRFIYVPVNNVRRFDPSAGVFIDPPGGMGESELEQ